MNEPKRWLDDGASEVMGRLLRAASDEQPSATAVERAVVASACAAVKSAPLASAIFLKWTLLGCLVTLGAGGVAVSLSSPPPDQAVTPARLASSALTDTAVQRAEPPPIPDSVKAHDPASARQIGRGGALQRRSSSTKGSPPSATKEATVVVDVELLAHETKLVDKARGELAAGRAASALAVLDEYQARFPHPRYAPEALYLRMEALLVQGNRHSARQVAERLAAKHATSPHAARAEAVLATTIP